MAYPEGVALDVMQSPDRYEAGVPVSAPQDASPAPVEQSGQQAESQKEK